MRIPYSFSVLRYVHDPMTQEFVNIGVAVYSAEAKYLSATCESNYGRISRMFTKIDGNRFREQTRYIQERLRDSGENLSTRLPFDSALTIDKVLAKVLPIDDSSFQFSPPGVGVSHNLDKTLSELFERLVERYLFNADRPRRDDEEVWKVFREPLERREVATRLVPKKIIAANYDYEFQHSWKNGLWHVYEPISFDLLDPGSILEKANRWLGRAVSLNDSHEKFKMHMLLGEPQDSHLRNTFEKAKNILHKMPNKPDIITEKDAESFAKEVATEMKTHPQKTIIAAPRRLRQ